MSTDPLLQPFKLGHLTLKNRIFSSSHAPGYNTDGTPNERYMAYHEEKAKGGIGLTMIGGSSNVSPDSASLWGQLYFGSDAIIDPLSEMTERIKSHGAAVMCQITHMGRRNVSNDGDWLPTIAPSPIREPMHRGWPKEIEKSDIRRVVADFGAAAIRAHAGGLDGIELCATSHLIDQFWTPLANRRTDEYGGSVENRLRFTMETLASIRASTGTDLLVGIRMVADEGQIGGLSREESADIAQRLATSGLLDFINVTSSSLATEEGLVQSNSAVGHAAHAVRDTRRVDQTGDRPAGPACHEDHRRVVGASRNQQRPDRPSGNDAGPHRRPAHRQQDRGRQRGPHPGFAWVHRCASTGSILASILYASRIRLLAAKHIFPS